MEMVCFLRRYARRMRVRSGALIISEGGLGASIFFLISGRAQVLKITGCHEEAMQELLPGCFFGCTSLSGDKGYPASVAAAKDCELYELKRESFSEALLGDPAMMMHILCASSEWLLETDRNCIEKLAKQNSELARLVQLRNSPESVRSPAAGIIHHLNNPLSSIYSVAQLLTLEYPEMEEARRIVIQCRTMMDIIRDLVGKSGVGDSREA
ncbi:MAG TPA: cyclic nucleotide-binding domain-containing protein [Deltaproteobacteria bacterium]|nr:cyclic nucleotide-binding domain-containing protein [Deltaproteobacteria bacterium]